VVKYCHMITITIVITTTINIFLIFLIIGIKKKTSCRSFNY
jgi:hypothetical protein